MGQTKPDVTPRVKNKTIYWVIAAAVAVLLIFALSATNRDRTDSTVVTPDQSLSAPMTAPAVDSTSANSILNSPDSTVVSPQSDTINNEGVKASPGTSVPPKAPKNGTVDR